MVILVLIKKPNIFIEGKTACLPNDAKDNTARLQEGKHPNLSPSLTQNG